MSVTLLHLPCVLSTCRCQSATLCQSHCHTIFHVSCQHVGVKSATLYQSHCHITFHVSCQHVGVKSAALCQLQSYHLPCVIALCRCLTANSWQSHLSVTPLSMCPDLAMCRCQCFPCVRDTAMPHPCIQTATCYQKCSLHCKNVKLLLFSARMSVSEFTAYVIVQQPFFFFFLFSLHFSAF